MTSSTERPTPQPAAPAAPQGQAKPRAAADREDREDRAVRPIPTPGDLFPRGVRAQADQEEELATGTG